MKKTVLLCVIGVLGLSTVHAQSANVGVKSQQQLSKKLYSAATLNYVLTHVPTAQSLYVNWDRAFSAMALARFLNTDLQAEGAEEDSIQQVLAILLAQLAKEENEKGLLKPYSRTTQTGDFIEVQLSSFYMGLLSQVGEVTKAKQRQQALLEFQWEDGNVMEKLPSLPTYYEKCPWNAGFFLAYAPETVPLSKAGTSLKYILDTQNGVGNWGYSMYDGSSEYYGMYPCVLALLRYQEQVPEVKAALQRAQIFILQSQNEDGSWLTRSYDSYGRPSPELETMLALLTCKALGIGLNDQVVQQGFAFLLQKHAEHGKWMGGTASTNNPNMYHDNAFVVNSLSILLLAELESWR